MNTSHGHGGGLGGVGDGVGVLKPDLPAWVS